MSNTKNKQANTPLKKSNSIFFPLIWNKEMVQYSCFFFELLQDALDFNDFGERKGGEIITPPNSPFLSQVSECLAAFLPYNICLAF